MPSDDFGHWEEDRWFERDTEARWDRQDEREHAELQERDRMIRDAGESKTPRPSVAREKAA